MFIHNSFVMFTTISGIKLHQLTVPHTLMPSTKKVAAAKVYALPSAGSSYLHIENAEGNVLIAVYLYACMRVIRISQKVLNRIAWNLVG